MTAFGSRYYVPYATAFDTSGIVSPGALLFFDETGTSTPVDTYSDDALTTPNTNPVVANGAGLFPSIFLTPGQQYKVVLETSDGDQIWTADPVFGGTGLYTGLLVYLSSFNTLAAADAAAVAENGALVIDANYTLPTDVPLSAATIFFAGGIITLGNFNLTFNSNAVIAAATKIFNYTGSGVVLGTIQADNYAVEWWGAKNNGTSGTATREAFQYAANYVLQSNVSNADIYCLGPTYLWDATGVTIVCQVYAPNFIGSGVQGTTTVSFSPAAEGVAFNFVGTSGAASERRQGGVRGVHFTGNANTICCSANDASFLTFDIGIDGSVKRAFLLTATTQFSESTEMKLYAPNVGPQCIPWEFRDGGTHSFANTTVLEGTQISVSQARSNPIVLNGTGCATYNVTWNDRPNNTSGSGYTYFQNNEGSGFPFFICDGSFHIEASDASPIVMAATNLVYFGGSMTTFGTSSINLSKFILTRTLNYASNGQLQIRGGAYQQSTSGAGNTTILIPSPFTSADAVAKVFVVINNGDSSYQYAGAVELWQLFFGGSGTATVTSHVLGTDTHSYGLPTFGVDANNNLTVANGNWPSGTFTISYEFVTP